MKKNPIVNFILVTVAAFVLARQAPVWIQSFRTEGKPAPMGSLKDLAGNSVAFPPTFDRWVVVFWATWCGPCKVELDRLADAVNGGKIKGDRILAISSGEAPDVVAQAQAERKYPYTVLVDTNGALAKKFLVSATPSVFLLNKDNRVVWATSGISPTLTWRVERFLNQQP